jgi:hypothetical protein
MTIEHYLIIHATMRWTLFEPRHDLWQFFVIQLS